MGIKNSERKQTPRRGWQSDKRAIMKRLVAIWRTYVSLLMCEGCTSRADWDRHQESARKFGFMRSKYGCIRGFHN